jgi:diguanylate cyclase (GGDEF)-like protein/PAS domain S-box-containing protein
MGKALLAAGVWHNERLFQKKTGATFWCSEKVSPVREPEGDVKHYVTVIEDISERKQAQARLEQSRNQLNEAQRLARVGSWSLDLASNQLEWSDEIYRIFELDSNSFGASYQAFLDAIHPDDVAMVNRAYTESVANRSPYDIVHRLRMADGRIKYVHECCETLYAADGTPLHSRGTIQDVTERTLDQESMQLYANVFRYSREGILITDQDNRIIAVNPALMEITGYDLEDLEGQNPRLLSSGRTPREVYQAMWASLNSQGHWQGELWDRRKNGQVYPKWASISAIRDSAGNLINYIASFTDISERKATEERIQHLANHDPLTGLLNRNSMENRMQQMLLTARREQQILALLFIDLDRFKYVNDTFGHPAGDSLLMEIASRLRNSVRESDMVVRLGGDEYIVVLNTIDSGEVAASVANKLLTTISQPCLIGGTEVRSGACIGISTYPNDGDDTATLMKHADTAMYHAKKLGRNTFQFFDPAMNAAAGERLSIEHDLHTALRDSQFELHYQPKVNAGDGRISGVEALIRWRHPQRGLIPPLKFIPIAEETGQIVAIGDWVLEEACRQQAEWRAQGVPNPQISVNLSAHQLRSPGLVGWVQRIMQRFGMRPGELELEITESAAMDAPDKAILLLNTLRDLGVALAIDDFGTGYSSLAYLKLLPIQTLKLDRAFVRDIETDENDAAISSATLALAHNLGLKVVAEGVETEGQRAYLLAHDCDYLQGYLFSKPLPAAEIRDFILKGAQA